MRSVPERVAVIFMTVTAVTTVALGLAVIHELGAPATTTAVQAGAASVSVTATTATTAATTATTAPAATAGHLVTVGGSGGTGQGAVAASGNSSAAPSSGGAVAAGGVITVGGIFDETGPFDATVERDTVKSWFQTVNAQGGINGHKFNLIDCDSGYDPTKAHNCANYLLNQNVLAIVGWTSPSGEDPETKTFADAGVPMIGGLGTPQEFSSPLSWPTDDNFVTFGTAMGAHAKDLGINAPGIVIVTVPFIAPTEKALLDSLHAHGITEKDIEEVDPTKADYTDVVLKLQSKGVDSIVAALDPFSYARLFQAMERQNYKTKFLGLGLDKKSAEQQYGSAAYGAYSLTPLLEPDGHEGTAPIADYYATVKKYYPSQVAALDIYTEIQWTAAHVFTEAVSRVGPGAITRQSLANALNAIKNYDIGLSTPLSYGPGNHDPNRCFQWIHNDQGSWKTDSGWNCF